MNGTLISPQSGFKESVDRLGIGLAGKFAVKLGDSPFYAGLSIGGANYGSDTHREILVWPVQVEVNTNNNILFTHLLLQARADMQPIQPYVEGLIGFNYLWTESKIKDVDDYNDEHDIASQTHFDDFAMNYGAGFGLLIKLKSFDMDEGSDKEGNLFLDFKVRYLFGGEAEYLKEGDIEEGENKEVILHTSQSDTDFMSFHIGVVLQIN
ncbi:hypothetical protein H8E88_04680 [candidate division KSB1 bacterium]|nr:hypothetical protein [candidate division KSB1 bacterium]